MSTTDRPPTEATIPVRRLYLRLPSDLGAALVHRARREDRAVKVEAVRLLRAALEASGDLTDLESGR